MKFLRILVDKDGTTTMAAEGFQGTECKDALRPFESLGNVLSGHDTPEMYQTKTEESVRGES